MKTTATKSKILYADDDIDDCFFMSESVSHSELKADLIYVSNGEEAIKYLETAKNTNTLPSLIVLDLNMPKRNGKETLAYIKGHPQFSDIPVIMLSTSENKVDIEYCSQKGAASYFKKPVNFSGYEAIVKSFISFVH